MSDASSNTFVETALGDALAETLKGDTLGSAIVASIDLFVFRDIQTYDEALEIFAFVQDDSSRMRLAATFRGARWQQKVGLVLARSEDHPAHASQVRSQIVEYGAIAEFALRLMLEQRGEASPPKTFDKIIKAAAEANILSGVGEQAAEHLRLSRNRVHLFLDGSELSIRAGREGREAYKALTAVVNECRAGGGLEPWKFGSRPLERVTTVADQG